MTKESAVITGGGHVTRHTLDAALLQQWSTVLRAYTDNVDEDAACRREGKAGGAVPERP